MKTLNKAVVIAAAGLVLSASAAPSKGRYVHVRLARIPAVLSIAELEVYSGGRNVAKGKRATQSSLGSGGVPERAVDGNTNHDWGGRSITHTNEGEKKKPQWWEVDLGTSVSVDKIVLYNRKDFSHRSDGVQVFLLDENRRVVRGQSFIDAGPLVLTMDLVKDKCAELAGKTMAEVNASKPPPPPPPPPPIDDETMLAREALKWFNAEAMERAIRAYAEKYPQAYGDSAALLARVAEAKSAVASAKTDAAKSAAAAAILKLQGDVYLRHPAVDFSNYLFVKRSRRSHSGLPHNWQGNSSVPLRGYANSIISMPIRRKAGEKGQTLVDSKSFLGDVDLDFDADKIAYSGGLDTEKRWCVLETRLDAPLKQKLLSPAGLDDIDCYDPCYLPDGRMLFVSTSGFHGVPCVTGHDYVGNTHLLEKDGTVKRLVFDQDNSWCPVVMNNGRVLYLRWEYTDSAHYFSRVMMTMNIDGSDQKAFYGTPGRCRGPSPSSAALSPDTTAVRARASSCSST